MSDWIQATMQQNTIVIFNMSVWRNVPKNGTVQNKNDVKNQNALTHK